MASAAIPSSLPVKPNFSDVVAFTLMRFLSSSIILEIEVLILSDNGYSVGRIPSEFKFEGRGDAFVYGDYLVGSYGIRSDKEALLFIAEEFQLEPIIVELAQEKFYHLDTCFQQFPIW